MKSKNILTLAFLCSLISAPAVAQLELGLQLSPSLSFNRIDDDAANLAFSTDGVGGRIMAGVIGDFYFRENYAFSTGLFFVPRRVGLEDADNIEESYRLHYLQIPAALKLFTNEVALDTRIYFQVGLTLDVKILEDNLSEEVRYIPDYRNLDSNVLIGSGVEYRFGYTTKIYGGLSYRRGLVNVIKETAANAGDLIIKNDMLSLDLGVKF